MLYYCDRCGNLGDEFDNECFCCGNSPLKPIPREYTDNFRWRDGDGKQAFIEDVVKKSPNLDPYLFEHKEEIIQKYNDEMNIKMAIGKAIGDGADPDIAFKNEGKNIPKCPICGSVSLSKISNVGKAASVGLFGIFGAGDLGKTWKCNNCGSKF